LADISVLDRAGVDLVQWLRGVVAGWDRANDDETFPADRLRQIGAAGGLAAFVELACPADVEALLATLRLIGGADLSVGRIYEGHVNATQLVAAYGDGAQREALGRDIAAGRLFGIWNTERAPGVTIAPDGDGGYRLAGAKSFATGAGHIDRALITARAAGGRQLVLVDVADGQERADPDGWRVRGMRGTCSGLFDFTGMIVGPGALIGGPGDYEREPRFSAGAWRFLAVQFGAVAALVRHLRDHLVATGKAEEPVQRARFAACLTAARGAGIWVERAARLAEAADERAVSFVLMARGVVEEAALAVMDAAARGVGTEAFFAESRIDRITRDLGLYLRQALPDDARDRAAAAWLARDCWDEDRWW